MGSSSDRFRFCQKDLVLEGFLGLCFQDCLVERGGATLFRGVAMRPSVGVVTVSVGGGANSSR